MEGYETTTAYWFRVPNRSCQCSSLIETSGVWDEDDQRILVHEIVDVFDDGRAATSAIAKRVDGSWAWLVGSDPFCNEGLSAAILDHLNKYPPPKMEESR